MKNYSLCNIKGSWRFMLTHGAYNFVMVEITYQLSNFNRASVEVWKWIEYSIPHFTGCYKTSSIRRTCWSLRCSWNMAVHIHLTTPKQRTFHVSLCGTGLNCSPVGGIILQTFSTNRTQIITLHTLIWLQGYNLTIKYVCTESWNTMPKYYHYIYFADLIVHALLLQERRKRFKT